MVTKRLENVRGVGSVTLVGGVKREIQIYVGPVAMEALGVGADQVIAAVGNENQDLPIGAIRRWRRNAWCRCRAAWATRGLRPHHRHAQGPAAAAAGAGRQVATVVDGQQEQETLALYNGRRTLC